MPGGGNYVVVATTSLGVRRCGNDVVGRSAQARSDEDQRSMRGRSVPRQSDAHSQGAKPPPPCFRRAPPCPAVPRRAPPCFRRFPSLPRRAPSCAGPSTAYQQVKNQIVTEL